MSGRKCLTVATGEYRKRSRLRDTEMAEPWLDRSEVSYLECILGLWRMVMILLPVQL